MGTKERSGCPNKISAGLLPSADGVLRSSNNPCRNASAVMSGEVVATSFFIRFTAASASPFDWGLCGEDVTWETPHVMRNWRNSSAAN